MLSILEKIQEEHRRTADFVKGIEHNGIRTIQGNPSDIDQIKQALQAIIDKLHGLDQYIRENDIKYKKTNLYEGQIQKSDKHIPVL